MAEVIKDEDLYDSLIYSVIVSYVLLLHNVHT